MWVAGPRIRSRAMVKRNGPMELSTMDISRLVSSTALATSNGPIHQALRETSS